MCVPFAYCSLLTVKGTSLKKRHFTIPYSNFSLPLAGSYLPPLCLLQIQLEAISLPDKDRNPNESYKLKFNKQNQVN